MPIEIVMLIPITLIAAIVNGALGYGFSSITVPLALLFHTNRILNPALVVVEVILNSYALFVNREAVPRVWRSVIPILIGLLPGIIIGGYFLSSLHPGWMKLITYCLLIPLILLQAAGIRKRLQAKRIVTVPFGVGVGALYSVTTISGPPLALFLNNQGYLKNDFRAALAIIRVVESTLTATMYYVLGLYSATSMQLSFFIIPSIAVGVPIGAYLIRRIDVEAFRRIAMSFDAWVVGFGLSQILISLSLLSNPMAYTIWGIIILIDAFLLYYYFTNKRVGLRSMTKGTNITERIFTDAPPQNSQHDQEDTHKVWNRDNPWDDKPQNLISIKDLHQNPDGSV